MIIIFRALPHPPVAFLKESDAKNFFKPDEYSSGGMKFFAFTGAYTISRDKYLSHLKKFLKSRNFLQEVSGGV